MGVIILAFAAGFALAKDWSGGSGVTAVNDLSHGRRIESLRLLDRAVRARFGQLHSEAARLAFEVWQVDEQTPGIDIFIGEMALEQGDTDAVASAARAALRREPASASAKLLLALREWMLRGQNGTAQAGASASELLQQAATDELSNGVVRFFAGDFLRAVGRPGEAHVELLGSLYRQHVWHSAALLTAKLYLALEDSVASGSPAPSVFLDPELAEYGKSATAPYRAIGIAGSPTRASLPSPEIFTAKQLHALCADQSFASAPSAYTGSGPISPPPYGGVGVFNNMTD